jgi:TOTE conflict system primase-like protein
MAGEQKKTAPSDQAGRLYRLFRSNQRSVGRFDPKTGKVRTDYRGPTVQDFLEHLETRTGVGCVPIQDDNFCWWAAIDIDNHGQEEDVPIAPIDAKVKELKIPVIPCRSKSGGVHVYLFLEKAQPAARIRNIMAKWAGVLGYGGSEIFPKQSILRSNTDGRQQMGNWINLPYLGADATNRYAYRDGKKLKLDEFLTYAEKNRATEADLNTASIAGHENAPPCVQKMMMLGVDTGHRNEAMYQTVIYLKKAYPEAFEAQAVALNAVIFAKPLARSELMRTIGSASRPSYSFRCGEEPAHSLCDRDLCVTRKFGINRNEFDLLNTQATLPEFTELTKYLSEPVRWEMKIGGKLVTNVSTQALLDWKIMREFIAERLTRVVPKIKDVEWERILTPIMANARIVEAPDDASVAGTIRERLREFASKADLTSKGEDTDERRALLRGLPCVQVMDGERMVVWRAQDFVNYLKRTKSEELKGVNLWFAIKDLGVGATKIRVGERDSARVWYVPVKEVVGDAGKVEAPKFKSKL